MFVLSVKDGECTLLKFTDEYGEVQTVRVYAMRTKGARAVKVGIDAPDSVLITRGKLVNEPNYSEALRERHRALCGE